MKKFVALTLVAALAAGSTVVAFAGPATNTGASASSGAGVELTATNVDGIHPPTTPPTDPDTGLPVDPPDVTVPGGPEDQNPGVDGNKSRFETLDIDFGKHGLPQVDTTYKSLDDSRTAAKRTIDMYISVERAENIPWVVSVSVSNFDIAGQLTLQGFNLDLLPEDFGQGGPWKANGSGTITQNPVNGLTATSGDTPAMEGENGIFGINYAGELSVKAHSGREGDAQATLTWTFAPKVTP